jgi:hypothetical protein
MMNYDVVEARYVGGYVIWLRFRPRLQPEREGDFSDGARRPENLLEIVRGRDFEVMQAASQGASDDRSGHAVQGEDDGDLAANRSASASSS